MGSVAFNFAAIAFGAVLIGGACSGGDGPKAVEALSCVRDLTKDCPPQGTCGQDLIVTTIGDATCHPDGPDAEQVTEVKKPDGTLCYTLVEASHGGLCESHELTWEAPDGTVVAHAGGSQFVTCPATGETLDCSAADANCSTITQVCKPAL